MSYFTLATFSGRAAATRPREGPMVRIHLSYRGDGKLSAVGWYENATFNPIAPRPASDSESPDEDGNRFTYLITTDTAYLISPDQRQDGGIPGDHFRQSSLVYARGQGSTSREELAKCAEQIVAGQGEHDGKAKRSGLGGVPEDPAFLYLSAAAGRAGAARPRCRRLGEFRVAVWASSPLIHDGGLCCV